MILLLLAGCSSADAALRADDTPCFTANQCGTGFICLSNECVPNSAVGPDQVHVEIAPPTGLPYARTQFLDAIAIGGVLNLQFPAPAEFEVTVLKDLGPIGATIAVFGADRIPDREVDVTQALNPMSSVLRLLPGTYSVRLIPDDRSLPGFEATDFVVRKADARQTKEFTVPAQYRTLFGAVVSGVSGSETKPGVLVRAVGQRSGLPSTEAISGADGSYSLQLPDTSETQFLLTAKLYNVPEASWEFEQLVKVETQMREKQIQLESTDDALRGSVRLRIFGEGPNGPETVAGANVTLTATTTLGLDTRKYELAGTTDASGYVALMSTITDLPILAERYLVEVRTPERSPYASTVEMKDFSSARLGTRLDDQITLVLRTRVVGQIASASNSPVPDATVELIPFDERARTIDTETEDDGTFFADVDPGRYLIVIRPPRSLDGELLPVHIYEVQIGAGDRYDLPLINLPIGSEVTGTVRGEGAAEIAGARVEFFVRQADRTISIARTITDPHGYYSVVLPNPR